VNGYDDWFLPSRDELHQMYGNLVRRGLGGFKGEDYWSSTPSDDSRYFWSENLSNGNQEAKWLSNKYRVRAIRQF
jgi:hypothetical protein